MTDTPPDGWLHSWMGEAVMWECDELGHLNMRHYVAKAGEARRFLFIHLGLDRAFTRGASSTVRASTITTCYLREARPGARLSIRSGISRLGDTDADVVHVMHHADGERAATIQETVAHVSRRTGQPFQWPARLRNAVERVSPTNVGPRGLPRGEVTHAPDRAALVAMGASRVGAGVFRADEADVFGTVRACALQGRVSESVGNFREGWPEAYGPGGTYNPSHDPEADGAAHLSGVLLEMRLFLHRAATPGQAFEVFSGVQSVADHTRQLVHAVVDPVSGESYASMSATSAIMDLDRRKLVKTTDEARATLEAVKLQGLTP